VALILNGSNQYLSATVAVATAPPIAMSCWFWVDPAWSSSGALVTLAAANPSLERFSLYTSYTTSTLRCVARGVDTTGDTQSTTTLSTGVWQHGFCVFYNNSSRTVWLDGSGAGSNSVTQTPSSLAHTIIGVARIAAPYNEFKGRVAETAIWAGSGVEGMGAEESALLAAGLSPLCLTRRLGNLVSYQSLIRAVNWPGIGPEMTAQGAPSVVAHPRATYPVSPAIGLHQFPPFIAPYRLAAAVANANRVRQGWAAVAGPSVGDTYPVGEVSG